jgi:hypothetical protein
VRLIHDDGRSFLGRTDQRYDLITSEPPPPMAAGVYRLYSAEYYRDALAHLTPGGWMTQWLPVYQMPREAVELAIRTFVSVFPHALLYVGFESELILAGSAMPPDMARLVRRFGEARRARIDLRGIRVEVPEQLLVRIMRTDAALRRDVGTGRVISDQHNDLDQLYLRPDGFALIPYEPREVLAYLHPQVPELAGQLEAIMLHLGRLRYHVPGFPLFAVVRDPAIRLSEADWVRLTALQRQSRAAAQAGDGSGAAQALGQALTMAPEQPYLLSALADLQLGRGEFVAAEQNLRRFLLIEPGTAAAFGSLGSALLAQGRAVDALTAFGDAVALRPDWPLPMNNAAWILATHPDAEIVNPELALDLAQKAAELTGRREPIALGTLGAAFAASGRFAEAQAVAQQAVVYAVRYGQTKVAEQSRSQLESYRQGRRFIDITLAASPTSGKERPK